MRFTRTRLSDIVHPVSSSQLAETHDRVRSFGGNNKKDVLHGRLSRQHMCFDMTEKDRQVSRPPPGAQHLTDRLCLGAL
jgi:hypothetical protein